MVNFTIIINCHRAQIFNNLDIYHFRGKRSFERSDAGPVQILVGRV